MSERETTQVSDMGLKRYKERIDKDSRGTDRNSKLPFTFSKPKKEKACNKYFKCDSCGHEGAVTEDTLLIICGGCNCLIKVKDRRPAEQY